MLKREELEALANCKDDNCKNCIMFTKCEAYLEKGAEDKFVESAKTALELMEENESLRNWNKSEQYEREELQKQNQKLREFIKSIDRHFFHCPWCNERNPDRHIKNCKLNQALKGATNAE